MKYLRNAMAWLLALCLTLSLSFALAEDGHFLLSEKDWGRCKRLTGDVELAVVLVSLPEAAWSGEAREGLEEKIRAAAEALEEMAAGYGVPLRISARYYTTDAAQGIALNEDSGAWAERILGGDPSLPDFGRPAAEGGDRPVLFCINAGGRAFASSNLTENTAEYLVLYMDEEVQYSLMHELMHLYGAWDYYLHPEVKAAAQTCCPDSLMLYCQAGSRVDSLTAYIIGWTDVLDEAAQALLAATAHLTEDDIWLALAEETLDGFHVIREDGYVYTGLLESGVHHGWGRQVWDDGTCYEGRWVWGVMQGRGRYTWPGGIVYTGDFADGQRTGQGVLSWPDGASYAGEFLDGVYHGTGTIRYADGASYTGEFENGVYHGTGTIRYADGSVYTGEFENGAYHGTGMLCFANGCIYSGSFENNQYHGQGTYAWPDGSLYTGGYANGLYQGYGVFYSVDGTVMEGQWEQGTFVN